MKRRHYRYEFGNATIIVTRATESLDKFCRGYYRADVHPVGGCFFRCWLRAKSPEEAAHFALWNYQDNG